MGLLNSLVIKCDLSYGVVTDCMMVARHCMTSCTTLHRREDRGQSLLNFEEVQISETTICDFFFITLGRATRANIFKNVLKLHAVRCDLQSHAVIDWS